MPQCLIVNGLFSGQLACEHANFRTCPTPPPAKFSLKNNAIVAHLAVRIISLDLQSTIYYTILHILRSRHTFIACANMWHGLIARTPNLNACFVIPRLFVAREFGDFFDYTSYAYYSW